LSDASISEHIFQKIIYVANHCFSPGKPVLRDSDIVEILDCRVSLFQLGINDKKVENDGQLCKDFLIIFNIENVLQIAFIIKT
jgi:hypothetical protein